MIHARRGEHYSCRGFYDTDASSGLGIPPCLATNGYEITPLRDKNHCKMTSSHSTFTLHRTSGTLTLAVQRYWTVFLSSRSSRLQKKSRLAISSISTQETSSKNRIWCALGGVSDFKFVPLFERCKAFNFHTHINHFAHLSSTTVLPFKTMSKWGW